MTSRPLKRFQNQLALVTVGNLTVQNGAARDGNSAILRPSCSGAVTGSAARRQGALFLPKLLRVIGAAMGARWLLRRRQRVELPGQLQELRGQLQEDAGCCFGVGGTRHSPNGLPMLLRRRSPRRASMDVPARSNSTGLIRPK
jgi:hypothetical protein